MWKGAKGTKRVVGRKRKELGKKSSRAEGGEGPGGTERVVGKKSSRVVDGEGLGGRKRVVGGRGKR